MMVHHTIAQYLCDLFGLYLSFYSAYDTFKCVYSMRYYEINNYINIYYITPHETNIMVNTTENANFIWSIANLLRGEKYWMLRANIMILKKELEGSLKEILG